MLLTIGKEIRSGIYYSINGYEKAKNKSITDYSKNKELSYLKYRNVNNFYDSSVSQKLSVNSFEWAKYISEFDESFLKSYNE